MFFAALDVLVSAFVILQQTDRQRDIKAIRNAWCCTEYINDKRYRTTRPQRATYRFEYSYCMHVRFRLVIVICIIDDYFHAGCSDGRLPVLFGNGSEYFYCCHVDCGGNRYFGNGYF